MYLCVIEWFYSSKLRQTLYKYMCKYVYIYVCMFVYMYVCLYICMYVCMYDDDVDEDVPMSKDDLYRAQACTR